MPITQIEAQEALRDIQQTGRASATARGYQRASPHLILWGVIWAVGYGLSYARPQYGLVWPALVVIGTIASFWLGWKSKPAGAGGYDWRYGATALAVFLFITAVFAVMPPQSVKQLCAFFPILVALRQWSEEFDETPEEIATILVDRESARPVKKLELRARDGRLLSFSETTLKPRPATKRRRSIKAI